MSVHRDMYEKAKDAAKEWHRLLLEMTKEKEKAERELSQLKTEVERLKTTSVSPKRLEELETEYKRQLVNAEERYKDKVTVMERDRILLDAQIQRQEDALRDYKERYAELKQDYREERKKNNKE